MAINWTLQTRKIADLKPHPRNPRKLSKADYEQLKTSIDKFGLIDKPIVTRDGSVIGGHQRLQVLKKMKAKQVECWVPEGDDISAEDIDELTIRLNRNTGEWDWDILANEWDEKELEAWGFQLDDFKIDTPNLDEEKSQVEKCPTCGKKTTPKRGK